MKFVRLLVLKVMIIQHFWIIIRHQNKANDNYYNLSDKFPYPEGPTVALLAKFLFHYNWNCTFKVKSPTHHILTLNIWKSLHFLSLMVIILNHIIYCWSYFFKNRWLNIFIGYINTHNHRDFDCCLWYCGHKSHYLLLH